jgi:hypothetical protein
MPRITRGYINKIKNISDKNKLSDNSISTTQILISTKSSYNDITTFKHKYSIISDIVYEVYNIKLPDINYLENKVLIKTLMNTIFIETNLNKLSNKKNVEEINYNKLKDLIGNIIDFPLYHIYKEYDNQFVKLVNIDFCLSKYKCNDNNSIKDKYSLKKCIVMSILFGIIFNIILFGHLFYTEIHFERFMNNLECFISDIVNHTNHTIDIANLHIMKHYSIYMKYYNDYYKIVNYYYMLVNIENIKFVFLQYIIVPTVRYIDMFMEVL